MAQNFPVTVETTPSGTRANVISVLLLLALFGLGALSFLSLGSIAGLVVGVGLGILASTAPQVAKQWERAAVLRLGRYRGLRGPGVFWMIPFVDHVSAWIDQRVITTSFGAEETLTSDTVPVAVDAVLFWSVHNPEHMSSRTPHPNR